MPVKEDSIPNHRLSSTGYPITTKNRTILLYTDAIPPFTERLKAQEPCTSVFSTRYLDILMPFKRFQWCQYFQEFRHPVICRKLGYVVYNYGKKAYTLDISVDFLRQSRDSCLHKSCKYYQTKFTERLLPTIQLQRNTLKSTLDLCTLGLESVLIFNNMYLQNSRIVPLILSIVAALAYFEMTSSFVFISSMRG